MEVLINLIVTVAIIIAVLKRMTEVVQKGGEITKPPVPRPMFPERPETPETAGEVLTGEPVADERQGDRAARMRERLREIQLRLDAQRRVVEKRRKSAEERFEAAGFGAAPAPVRVSRAGSRPHSRKTARKTPLPVFGNVSLAQGIVMSEILGPPVSLREAGRWW